MNVVGIDPGLKGALVVLGDQRHAVLQMPVSGKEIDGAAIGAWLLAQEVELAVVEKLGARNVFNTSGKAVRRAGNEFRFATGYGVILGVLQSMAIPYRLVLPMNWKARLLAGTDKAAAIEYVQRRYPEIDLTPGRCRVPQDGIADAACLADYGRRFGRQVTPEHSTRKRNTP